MGRRKQAIVTAALPEEFSGETRDAKRWLMAMEAYFTLHEDKYPNIARTVVLMTRNTVGHNHTDDRMNKYEMKWKYIRKKEWWTQPF